MLGGFLSDNILCLLSYSEKYAKIIRNSVALNLYGGLASPRLNKYGGFGLNIQRSHRMTIWKDIPGFSIYEISEDCVIRVKKERPRPKRGRNLSIGDIVKQSEGSGCRGYAYVTLLNDNGKRIYSPAHRILALAFYGPPPAGIVACHKDDNRRNNHYTNIYLGTELENSYDKVMNGNCRNQHGGLRFDPEIIKLLRKLHAAGETVASLAREIGAKWTTTYDAIHRTYKWVR